MFQKKDVDMTIEIERHGKNFVILERVAFCFLYIKLASDYSKVNHQDDDHKVEAYATPIPN